VESPAGSEALDNAKLWQDEAIDQMVENLLSRYRNDIHEYLSGAEYYEIWASPEEKMMRYVSSLKIPSVAGRPNLLLHSLGGVVDQRLTSDIFTVNARDM
jgi:hypothetical protein